MKPLVILNPNSQGGKTGERADELLRVIQRYLGELDCTHTNAEAEALRAKHRELTDEIAKAEREISELEKKLADDYGGDARWLKLSSECFVFAPGGEFS